MKIENFVIIKKVRLCVYLSMFYNILFIIRITQILVATEFVASGIYIWRN